MPSQTVARKTQTNYYDQSLNSPLSREAKWVFGLSIANLLAVLLVAFFLFSISEQWWLAAALTYLPRFPYVVPAIILGVCGWFYHRSSIGINVASALVVMFPIMGFQIPWQHLTEPAPVTASQPLKILSCNVQGFQPNFVDVLKEISSADPDIIAFQETLVDRQPALANRYFQKWHVVKVEELWVASKYPVKLVEKCYIPTYDRLSAIAVEVETPDGPLLVFNLHLMTARRGLTEVDPQSVLDGHAKSEVDTQFVLRNEEAALTREFIANHGLEKPHVVLGDFNVPSSSNLYEANWGDYTNAFDAVGWGYGYTSPCRNHSFYFAYVPWVRIDHVLPSEHFYVKECSIGEKNGSDHRLIVTTLLKRDFARTDL